MHDSFTRHTEQNGNVVLLSTPNGRKRKRWLYNCVQKHNQLSKFRSCQAITTLARVADAAPNGEVEVVSLTTNTRIIAGWHGTITFSSSSSPFFKLMAFFFYLEWFFTICITIICGFSNTGYGHILCPCRRAKMIHVLVKRRPAWISSDGSNAQKLKMKLLAPLENGKLAVRCPAVNVASL